MNKNFLLVLLFIMFALSLQAQKMTKEIVRLKTGEVYRGEIVMQNERVLMLQTKGGKRYQFLISDIDKITTQINDSLDVKQKDSKNQNSRFGVCTDINGGILIKNKTTIPISPNGGFAIALDSKKAFGTQAFCGVGLGMDEIFVSENEGESFYALPIFLHIIIPFSQGKIVPAVSSKAGYALSMSENYKSSLYFQLSGGVNIEMLNSHLFFLGLYAQKMSVYGRIIEKNELGTFIKKGNAPLTSIGLKVSFLF